MTVDDLIADLLELKRIRPSAGMDLVELQVHDAETPDGVPVGDVFAEADHVEALYGAVVIHALD